VKPAAFKYSRARSADEAVALIAAAGEDARFLAGGQSLVPMMNFRVARPRVLVDLAACADLAFVRRDGGKLRVGAMTRQSDAESDALVRELCPMLSEALAHAGPRTVRNRATVGGSIANGYPLAQLPCVAVCLGAEMVLQSARGSRTVRAEDFFVAAMVTAAAPDELLREIVFPCAGPRTRHAFSESGNHAGGSALAIVCGRADGGGVSLAVSGVDNKPLRLRRAEELPSPESAEPADEHARYARQLARVLLDRVMERLGK
jgi:CO/xanthine dehydrogenase FAD-binding subunit